MNWSPITWALSDGEFRAMAYEAQGTDTFSWRAWCATDGSVQANGDHIRTLAEAQEQAETAIEKMKSPAEGERNAIVEALEAKLKAWGDDYVGGGLSRGTREQLNQEMHGLRTAIGIVEARKL